MSSLYHGINRGIEVFRVLLKVIGLIGHHSNGIDSLICLALLTNDVLPILMRLSSINVSLFGNLEKLMEWSINRVVSTVLHGLVHRKCSILASFNNRTEVKVLSLDISHSSLFVNI